MDDQQKRRVELWTQINAYVVACGGNPDRRVYGNTARQDAVAGVEREIRGLQKALAVPVCSDCGKEPELSRSRGSGFRIGCRGIACRYRVVRRSSARAALAAWDDINNRCPADIEALFQGSE